MNETELYKAALLDHYRNPRNKGDVGDADVLHRGSNPRCGDEVEVGVYMDGDLLKSVRFRGRGCSICLASASMMTEAATGRSREEALRLHRRMHEWFDCEAAAATPVFDQDLPAQVQPLSAVRHFPARRQCVLLAWNALAEALRTKTTQ